MSLYSARSQAIFAAAARAILEPPEALSPDWLEGKPRGFCPWCGKELQQTTDGEEMLCVVLRCRWDGYDTEDENRIRYAAEQVEHEHAEARMSREASRRGLDF